MKPINRRKTSRRRNEYDYDLAAEEARALATASLNRAAKEVFGEESVKEEAIDAPYPCSGVCMELRWEELALIKKKMIEVVKESNSDDVGVAAEVIFRIESVDQRVADFRRQQNDER